ncbi:hypothetical protein V8C86DRAFT_2774487 [Haematococcus lacustris]
MAASDQSAGVAAPVQPWRQATQSGGEELSDQFATTVGLAVSQPVRAASQQPDRPQVSFLGAPDPKVPRPEGSPGSAAVKPSATAVAGLAEPHRGVGSNSAADGSSSVKNKRHRQQQQTWVLSEEEVDILRWARNSRALNPPKGCDLRAYKKATALEVLVAHLYLTDPTRCLALVDLLLGLPLTTSAPRS